jgi:hypothetical protein
MLKTKRSRFNLAVTNAPTWLQVIDFVKKAEKVSICATDKNIESLKKVYTLPELHPVTDREQLLELLKYVPVPPGAVDKEEAMVAACFCPHHFVVASGGNETVMIAICYSCRGIAVKSNKRTIDPAVSVRKDAEFIDGIEAERVFGKKVDHALVDCQYVPDE